jgi:hypothetical protein
VQNIKLFANNFYYKRKNNSSLSTKKSRPKATFFVGELGGIGFASSSSLGYASPAHSRVPLLVVKPASRGFSSSQLIANKKKPPKGDFLCW